MTDTPVSVLLDLLPDLNGGRFLEKADRALANAALSVLTNGDKNKNGRVTLEFTLSRIGDSNQVQLIHAIEFTEPTARGKRSETDSTTTPLHVGRSGKLTLMPDTQTRFEFDREDHNP